MKLDFGSSFPGATRFLEIHVRQAGVGALTTLSPRQPITSSPYSIKTLSADFAANAQTAVSATSFTGNLAGDITGTQTATVVNAVGGQTANHVANAAQSVTAATALNTPNTLVKRDASGNFGAGAITGDLTGNASTATNATQLGGVAATQYLQSNGSGAGLTNLNAGSITTGTLANGRLGQIPTANLADNAVTAPKISAGQVVKSVNGLTDGVTLVGTGGITITPAANTLTIASSAGAVGGGGTADPTTVPLWTGTSTLGNSLISQDNGVVRLPNLVSLTAGVQGNQIAFGSPNGETGLSVAGANGRADMRFGPSINSNLTTLKLAVGPAGGPPSELNGIAIDTNGNVRIGTNFAIDTPYTTKLQVNGGASTGVSGVSSGFGSGGTGVYGLNTSTNTLSNGGYFETRSSFGRGVVGYASSISGDNYGVYGQSASVSGTGVIGIGFNGAFFESHSNLGIGVEINQSGDGAALLKFRTERPWVFRQAYTGSNAALRLQPVTGLKNFEITAAGNTNVATFVGDDAFPRVGIGTIVPTQTLSVSGDAGKSQGGGAWAVFSDERLKNIKGRFTRGLAALKQLQPILYRYKTNNPFSLKADREEVGFSAQAVERVIPEAVTKNDQGYRMVHNDPILWAMLNAIKEQQAEIVSLRKRDKVKSAQIDNLRSLVCVHNRRAGVCRNR